MSNRYEYDPSKATALQEIFPKDEYEFIIGEPKAFIRKNRKGEDSFGVRFPLTIAEGRFASKRTMITCYLHSDGAQSMAKRFQMAAYGFRNNQEQEAEFNIEMAGKDWGFDPATGACGEMWRNMAGSRVVGALDVKPNEETGEPQQDFKSWRPLAKVAA